jgi:hypothetical protein
MCEIFLSGQSPSRIFSSRLAHDRCIGFSDAVFVAAAALMAILTIAGLQIEVMR